jgi:hypothetical protein
MAERKEIKVKDPDFVNQLLDIGMSERSIQDMTFTPGDHQFLVKLMTTRDDALLADVKKSLEVSLKENDNQICKDVSEIVIAQNRKISDGFIEVMKAVEGIASDLKDVKSDISIMKSDISNIKDRQERLEDKQETDADRIERIEAWIKNRKDLEERIKAIELNTGHIQDWTNLPEVLEARFKRIEGYKPAFELIKKRTSPMRMFWWTLGAILIGGALLAFTIIQIVKHLHETGKLIGFIS